MVQEGKHRNLRRLLAKYEKNDGDYRRVTEGTACPFYRVPQHGNFTVPPPGHSETAVVLNLVIKRTTLVSGLLFVLTKYNVPQRG